MERYGTETQLQKMENNLKVLVTGGSGFVGSETIRLLNKNGIETINYDIMSGGLDIRDYKQLNEFVKLAHPDRILHLAAIARFEEADSNVLLALETNVIGTANVARVAGEYHIGVVYSSTGSVLMPIIETPPITEKFRGCGNSVYGCAKFQGEEYIKKYSHPWMILRYSHLFGPEKRFHGLIGGFLSRIEKGLKPNLNGGRQSNDFLYIKDVAMANLLALTASWDKWGQIYNIGTGVEITAKEAGDAICKVFDYKGEINVTPQRTVDPDRFVFDISKAEKMLKFRAKWNFEDALSDMKKELGKELELNDKK